MNISCFNCSSSVLYPDGCLRCKLNNHLAVEPCAQYNLGSPEIYKIELEEPETVKQKVKPKKVKQVKSVAKAKKKSKPAQKRLL